MYIYAYICACVYVCVCMYICVCWSFSHVWLFASLWTVARQAPLSTGFSRQEFWSVLPCPAPGDLPDPGIKPGSPAFRADPLPSAPQGSRHRSFLNRSSVDGHLGLHVLAIVNSAAINIEEHVSFWIGLHLFWIYANEWDCWITW